LLTEQVLKATAVTANKLCAHRVRQVNMLSSMRLTAAGIHHGTAKNALVRPLAPVAVQRVQVRPTKAHALLWPQEQQRADPIDAVIQLVLSWLDPLSESVCTTEEVVPDYTLDDDDGHAGWGHSHIADRLATASSVSQDFDF
jgi:hypothetical protein